MLRLLEVFWARLVPQVTNKLNATKHKLPIADAELWTKSKVPQERLGNS
jgi:hypothetical protein